MTNRKVEITSRRSVNMDLGIWGGKQGELCGESDGEVDVLERLVRVSNDGKCPRDKGGNGLCCGKAVRMLDEFEDNQSIHVTTIRRNSWKGGNRNECKNWDAK